MNSYHVLDFISVLIAITAILHRKKIARDVIEYQNRTWGFHFGEREIRASEFVIVVTGITIVLLSALSLLGLIKSR